MNIIKRTFLVVLSMGLLASCSNPKTPTVTNEYLVNFNTDGGSFISAQRIKENGTIDPPGNPTRPYFNFSYWLCNGERYDDFTKPVTSDLTLKAVWSGEQPSPVDDYRLVSFDTDGGYYEPTGGTYIDTQVVSLNGYATEPTPAPIKKEGDFPYTFDGWFYEDETKPFEFTKREITDNIVLTAHWSGTPPLPPVYHVVNFDTDGGSYVASQRIEDGKKLWNPGSPTKIIEGYEYTFTGWYNGATYFDIDNDSVTDDLVLKAHWSGELPKYCKVDFDTDGGSFVESRKVKKGDPVDEPDPDPTKIISGYEFEFDGWYDGATEYTFNKPVNSDLVLTAHWKGELPVIFNVTFESNGGTHIEPVEATKGSKINPPTTPSKPDGSTFKGWFKDASLTTAWDFAKDTVNDNTTLYAKWEPPTVKHTITFVMNGATSTAIDPIKVNDGETAESKKPDNPTKNGYGFKGWFEDEALTDSFSFTETIKKDYILYAKWGDIKTYTASFYDGGAKIEGYDQTVKYGERVQRPVNPTKDKATFSGWYKDQSLQTLYDFNAEITDLISSTISIYAKWDNAIFAVNFASNGGTTVQPQNVPNGDPIKTSPSTTYTGHTFGGWFTDDGVFENEFKFGTLAEGATPVTSSMVLYAKWTLNTVKVTIDYNHDSSTQDINVDYGTIVPTLEIPTREGYSFTGWYEGPEDGAEAWDFGTKITESDTIYAHWTPADPDMCTLFYYPVGGTIYDDWPCWHEVPKGTKFENLTYKPLAWRADGTLFDCWSLDPTTKVTTGDILTDRVAYAFWQEEYYTKVFLDPTFHFTAYTGEFRGGRLVDPYKAISELESAEVKEGYTFKGFAYTQAEASAGTVRYTFDDFKLPVPDGFPKSGSLYPVFEINTYSLTYTEHGNTPFDPTPRHEVGQAFYMINYPRTFTCETKIVIEIELEPGPIVGVYYIPEAYKDKCFQIKCDGNMTTPVISLSDPLQEGSSYKKATITINKAEGNITLDSWLYLNPSLSNI